MKIGKRVSAKSGNAKKRQSSSTNAHNLKFYGEEFIFDTASGMFYRVNPTAGFILRALQTGVEADKLVEQVQARYNVTRAAAVRDIELLRNDLGSLGSFGSAHP